MLGSDVIGFHTQYHCNNFLETCNRYLEARIDWEHFSVTRDHQKTLVRAFPIGIDPSPVRTLSTQEIKDLKAKYRIYADIIAVGVDRLDYTKGLLERVESVERLLEKYPQYQGRFTLVQMGSPSRTHIPAYRALADQLEEAVERVNARYGTSDTASPYRPIVFLHEHHEWEEIQYFYQMGDVCMVTSLHDGMNLVAKEYVWCQSPERGALILSQFTGASRELTEALIVNPYSIEDLADTIATAIELPRAERIRRMLAMKEKVLTNTAFHWAAEQIHTLLSDSAQPENHTQQRRPP
jgi:trehalose 6-phosphate synthase